MMINAIMNTMSLVTCACDTAHQWSNQSTYFQKKTNSMPPCVPWTSPISANTLSIIMIRYIIIFPIISQNSVSKVFFNSVSQDCAVAVGRLCDSVGCDQAVMCYGRNWDIPNSFMVLLLGCYGMVHY